MERADEATEAGERLRAQQDWMAGHVAGVIDHIDTNLDEIAAVRAEVRRRSASSGPTLSPKERELFTREV